MTSKFKLVSIVLVATLIVVAGCSMMAFRNAQAIQMHEVLLRSRPEDLVCFDIGEIKVEGKPHDVPGTVAVPDGQAVPIEFVPPPGCVFVRWVPQGPVAVEVGVHVTSAGVGPAAVDRVVDVMVVTGDGGSLTAIYRGTCCVVGGVVKPTNSFLVLAPYLALAGLVTVGTAVCIKKRYH